MSRQLSLRAGRKSLHPDPRPVLQELSGIRGRLVSRSQRIGKSPHFQFRSMTATSNLTTHRSPRTKDARRGSPSSSTSVRVGGWLPPECSVGLADMAFAKRLFLMRRDSDSRPLDRASTRSLLESNGPSIFTPATDFYVRNKVRNNHIVLRSLGRLGHGFSSSWLGAAALTARRQTTGRESRG